MRWLAGLLLLAAVAEAHGGGRFRGPSPPVPPNIDCRCRNCAICTPLDEHVKPRVQVARRVDVEQRDGGVARVVVRIGFLTMNEKPDVVTVRVPGLVATSARVDRGGKRTWFVLRGGELRVYPVAAGAVTWATVKGIAPAHTNRIYHSGGRALVWRDGHRPETMPAARALLRYPNLPMVATRLAIPRIRTLRRGDPRTIPPRPIPPRTIPPRPYRPPRDPPDPPPPPRKGNPPR